jgi:polynucleotide 5'-kinase involved in rRNA processing
MSEYNHGRLNNLIIEGHKHMDNLKGKSGVLLVGNTSAGKSYLVNYLIGWPLKKTRLTANKINNLK